MPLMRRTWEIVDSGREHDRASHIFDLFLVTLISLNVTAVVLETVPWMETRWIGFFRWFEIVSVAVFTAEYLVRLWAAPADPQYAGYRWPRLRYAVSGMAIVDLIAILPFYLPLTGMDLRIARALRLMRLFRLAKLTRYLDSLRLFGEVARAKREELVLTSFVLGLLLLVSSAVMYFFENEAQPDRFSSIPATMWWGIVTLTTVGYGDAYPITIGGRLLGAVVALLGVGLVALPTAILGSGFVEAIGERRSGRQHACPKCGHEFGGSAAR